MFHTEPAAEKELSVQGTPPPSPAQPKQAQQAFGGNKLTALQSGRTGDILSTCIAPPSLGLHHPGEQSTEADAKTGQGTWGDVENSRRKMQG